MTWNSLTPASACFKNKTFSIDRFLFSGTVEGGHPNDAG